MDARRIRPILGLVVALSLAITVRGQIAVLPSQFPTHGTIVPHSGPTVMLANPVGWHPGSMQAVVAPAGSVRAGSASHIPGRTGGSSHRQHSVAHSENFIVFASDPQWASEVARVAEQQRQELAVHWLGHELPTWPQRCPLHVHDAETLGAGGETRFALNRGVPGSWIMSVQGTRLRILDSVLPHEITHTIFATHFGRLNKYVPRWADEGASTTVEHEAEKKKHRHFLQQFLKTGRGLSFNDMFRLKEYPQDILPLYAQGHSAVQFLLDQSGPKQFVQFIEMGMQTENWAAALQKHYAYDSIGDFQVNWNQWLRDGSPTDLANYAPLLRRMASDNSRLASGSLSGRQESSSLPVASSLPVVRDRSVPFNVAQPSARSSDPIQPEKSGLAQPEKSQLASAQLETNEDSWYKRKLHETSGRPATSIPPHNHFTGDPSSGLRSPSTAASRPQEMQTPGIQVLDWGDSGRISTSETNQAFREIIR